MGLPSSETLPTDINDLPPARQRHIRRRPRAASLAERQILLDSLLALSAPTLNFFLLSFLGSLIIGLSLYFNEPAILLLGLVVLPFLRPVFGLALFPHAHKFSHWIKSLVSLLIPVILTFFAGVLAGYLLKEGQTSRLDAMRFSAPYWLDLAAVALSAFLCVLIIIRQGKLPRKIGIILTYEILFPIAVAGYALPLGFARLWPHALLIGICHLVLSIFVTIIAFLILGFSPKHFTGWILAILPLVLSFTLLIGALSLSGIELPLSIKPIPTSTTINNPTNTPKIMPSMTSSPKVMASPTASLITQTKTVTPSITNSPTNTPSPTPSPTPQPTRFSIVVDSYNGVVIRESADFQAQVIGYANDGAQIEVLNQSLSENGSLWYQVETETGVIGWLLSSMVNTQTPAPTRNN
ncbi:MAG: SH3 domain-containing protein [Chloroflexota bacterium]|nr:SH3 domain-containing protein [Chloroflexota bacterium]